MSFGSLVNTLRSSELNGGWMNTGRYNLGEGVFDLSFL